MKILIGSDHAGFDMKTHLFGYLKDRKFDIEDCGPKVFELHDNYPEILAPLALRIAEQPEKYRGIVIGKSGQGEAMLCNRFPGVRAAVYYGGEKEEVVKLSREHNDANVLSLGAAFLDPAEAEKIVDLWLGTGFSGDERHVKRNDMLDNIS